MGCIHSKCCGSAAGRLCCCGHCGSSSPSARSAAAISDRFGGPADEAGRRHVLTGSAVGRVAVPSAGLCLQCASLSQRGYYPDDPERANQDCYCVVTNLQGHPDAHFFGVFDGHGQFGGECAQFVRDKLCEILVGDQGLISDPLRAFDSAFLATNEALHLSEIDDTMSGTTAITVLVKGDTMVVANVGDSRAVAGVWNGENVVAEELSWDQTPFRNDEYERVKRCGARVLSVDQVEGLKDPGIQNWGNEESDDGDPPRLWVQNAMYPGTAFTRSVGDSTAESIGVIAEPEIKTVKITPNHLFFVVASDGVFEFLSSQAVVDMVSRFVDPRDACSAIAAESYKLWLEHESRTDDITIIIVHIKDLCDSDAAEADEASHTNKDTTVSEKFKADKCVYPESESCHLNKDSQKELHYPLDITVGRTACIAPSVNSIDRNAINPD